MMKLSTPFHELYGKALGGCHRLHIPWGTASITAPSDRHLGGGAHMFSTLRFLDVLLQIIIIINNKLPKMLHAVENFNT